MGIKGKAKRHTRIVLREGTRSATTDRDSLVGSRKTRRADARKTEERRTGGGREDRGRGRRSRCNSRETAMKEEGMSRRMSAVPLGHVPDAL